MGALPEPPNTAAGGRGLPDHPASTLFSPPQGNFSAFWGAEGSRSPGWVFFLPSNGPMGDRPLASAQARTT